MSTKYTNLFAMAIAVAFTLIPCATATAQTQTTEYQEIGRFCPAPDGQCEEWEIIVLPAEQASTVVEQHTETTIVNTEKRGASLRLGVTTFGGHQTAYGASASIGFPLDDSSWRGEVGGMAGTNGETFVHGQFVRVLSPNVLRGDSPFELVLGPQATSVVDEGPLGGGNTRVGIYAGLFLRWSFGSTQAFALEGFAGGGPGFAEAAPDTRVQRRVAGLLGGGVGFSVDLVRLF